MLVAIESSKIPPDDSNPSGLNASVQEESLKSDGAFFQSLARTSVSAIKYFTFDPNLTRDKLFAPFAIPIPYEIFSYCCG